MFCYDHGDSEVTQGVALQGDQRSAFWVEVFYLLNKLEWGPFLKILENELKEMNRKAANEISANYRSKWKQSSMNPNNYFAEHANVKLVCRHDVQH